MVDVAVVFIGVVLLGFAGIVGRMGRRQHARQSLV